MSIALPKVPAGSGKHPIPFVVLSANRLAESTAFYKQVFGWHTESIAPDVISCFAPSGPSISLRANTPEGLAATVPFLHVDDVVTALARVTAAGGRVQREPWRVPVIGALARFQDPAGTVYGLTDGALPQGLHHVPMPLGDNPKPLANTVCSLEMFASDRAATAAWFGAQFGWGAIETMPGYTAFDVGAGIGGVFQSHTPAMPGVAYLWSDDVGETIARIEAAGGERVGDPMAMAGLGTFGYFRDPSGTTAGLIGP